MKSLLQTGASRPTTRIQVSVGSRTRGLTLLLFVCLLIVLLVPSDGYLGEASRDLTINQAIAGTGFRLAAWEVQALSQKAADQITQPGSELTPDAQRDLVLAYFEAMRQIGRLTADIERIYADPAQRDPASTAAPLQARLDALRAEQRQRRPAVERILERQVATVLEEAGLHTALGVLPPVRFQFTESPFYLIISPRQRIVMERGIYLDPGLSLEAIQRIEAQVEQRLDVSALIEGTGGFSSYPTMILEIPSLEWVLSTIAHEWLHTYLFFLPLGQHYYDNGDTRTMNETTASIVGDEIGRLTLERFYPDQVPPPPAPRAPGPSATPTPKPEFEFGTFMRETRLEADRLLAEGRVAEAEAYMESRRQELVSRGYIIRKLNQAYFAFHGAYAVGPAATDPIGDKLRELRIRAGSLARFVQIVSRLTTVAQLDAALAGLPPP